MAEENKTYILKTVQDIAEQIPEDKIDEFLLDFKTWLLLAKGNYDADKTIKDLSELVGVFANMENIPLKEAFRQDITKFVWCDDGKRNVSKIHIRAVAKEEKTA